MESSQIGLRQQLQKYFFPSKNSNNTNTNSNSNNININHSNAPSNTSSRASTPTSTITMRTSDLPRSEATTPSATAWMTPTTQSQQVPTTAPESFSYFMRDSNSDLSAWAASSSSVQERPVDAVVQPINMSQGIYPLNMISNPEPSKGYSGFNLTDMSDRWAQKSCEDNYDVHVLDPDAHMGHPYGTDDTISMMDMRYTNSMQDMDQMNFDPSITGRRMSGSSLTVSTNGLSDMPSYEDFSAALSEAPSFTSDYPPASNRNSWMSSTQLSPVASPRLTPQTRPEQVRAQSRGRASPSPRPSMRSAPYEIPRSNKRWSTGSSYSGVQRRSSPGAHHSSQAQRNTHSSGVLGNSLPMNMGNFSSAARPSYMMPGAAPYNRNSMILPTNLPSQLPNQIPSNFYHHHDAHGLQPPTLASHGVLRLLQSNGDQCGMTGRYADLSDPPDLYACLHEEQIPPPPEDMNPSDPDMVPYEQELRFEGDLYTPRWVRGHGNKREGWCGICKPGRWLVLKNSAFWYDKSFSHGISAATGAPFQEPLDSRRMNGNPDVWEGLCGSCNDWIPLVSSKKKGTTWFRHAYKCHTHPKIKDAPKRRRDNGHSRMAGQIMQDSKSDSSRPITPQMSTPSNSGIGTPPNSISCYSTPGTASRSSRSIESQQLLNMQQQQQQQHQRAPIPPPLRICSTKSQPTHLLSPVESYANMI